MTTLDERIDVAMAIAEAELLANILVRALQRGILVSEVRPNLSESMAIIRPQFIGWLRAGFPEMFTEPPPTWLGLTDSPP